MLLSHDQHPDNLDRLGRDYLAGVPLVLSTASAQRRLGGAVRALPNWEQTQLAAQTALLGDAYLTLTSQEAAEAARLLGAAHVVPVDFEGWAHFTQGADTLLESLSRVGLSERLHLLRPGERIDL